MRKLSDEDRKLVNPADINYMCKWCYAQVRKTKLGHWMHQVTWTRRHGFCDNILQDSDIIEFEDIRKKLKREGKIR